MHKLGCQGVDTSTSYSLVLASLKLFMGKHMQMKTKLLKHLPCLHNLHVWILFCQVVLVLFTANYGISLSLFMTFWKRALHIPCT